MKKEFAQLKVLLAEDAVSMRKIEISLLQNIGISQIIEAENGDDGIEQLQKAGKVDLIISDWNMPKKSGLSFLEWIRHQESFKDIPFIMATAQSDKGQEHVALKAGANKVLAKPFTEDELRTAIKAILDGPEKAKNAAPLTPVVNAAGKVVLRIAHIQITDHIILGVLKYLIENSILQPQHFELETRCMGGWNPVSQALSDGSIEGACILAPIAMDLFNFGVPIKLVLFAHRGGSIFVRSTVGAFEEPFQQFYKGRSVLIPHKLSIHHMLTHLFFKNIGLHCSLEKGAHIDVNLEVAPPIKMPTMLKEDNKVSGFMVAEPIGTKTIAMGGGHLQFLSNELWKGHPCCVLTLRDEVIAAHGKAVEELVRFLVQAGRFVTEQPGKAAEIAVPFLDPGGNLGLKVPVLRNVLMEQNGVRTDNLYPDIADLDLMQKYIVNEMGIGKLLDLKKFVDLRFADEVYKGKPQNRHISLLNDSPAHSLELLHRSSGGGISKTMLSREGKYLTFACGGQEFGIDIMNVIEIIGIMEIYGLPQPHKYIKGIINLRDRVIPVMDLRLRFGQTSITNTDRTCIVIVDGEIGGQKGHIGLIVDAVSEVMSIKADDIEETPAFTASVNTQYILAMAKKADKVKILLNLSKVLAI